MKLKLDQTDSSLTVLQKKATQFSVFQKEGKYVIIGR